MGSPPIHTWSANATYARRLMTPAEALPACASAATAAHTGLRTWRVPHPAFGEDEGGTSDGSGIMFTRWAEVPEELRACKGNDGGRGCPPLQQSMFPPCEDTDDVGDGDDACGDVCGSRGHLTPAALQLGVVRLLPTCNEGADHGGFFVAVIERVAAAPVAYKPEETASASNDSAPMSHTDALPRQAEVRQETIDHLASFFGLTPTAETVAVADVGGESNSHAVSFNAESSFVRANTPALLSRLAVTAWGAAQVDGDDELLLSVVSPAAREMLATLSPSLSAKDGKQDGGAGAGSDGSVGRGGVSNNSDGRNGADAMMQSQCADKRRGTGGNTKQERRAKAMAKATKAAAQATQRLSDAVTPGESAIGHADGGTGEKTGDFVNGSGGGRGTGTGGSGDGCGKGGGKGGGDDGGVDNISSGESASGPEVALIGAGLPLFACMPATCTWWPRGAPWRVCQEGASLLAAQQPRRRLIRVLTADAAHELLRARCVPYERLLALSSMGALCGLDTCRSESTGIEAGATILMLPTDALPAARVRLQPLAVAALLAPLSVASPQAISLLLLAEDDVLERYMRLLPHLRGMVPAPLVPSASSQLPHPVRVSCGSPAGSCSLSTTSAATTALVAPASAQATALVARESAIDALSQPVKWFLIKVRSSRAVDVLVRAHGLRTCFGKVSQVLATELLPSPAPAVPVQRPAILVGIIESTELSAWERFCDALQRECPEAVCLVRAVSHAPLSNPVDSKTGDYARRLMHIHTRCAAAVVPTSEPPMPTAAELTALAEELAAACADASVATQCTHVPPDASGARLTLVALIERWVRGGGGSDEWLACVQLEGFAPIAWREHLDAAASRYCKTIASSRLRALAPLCTDGVSWYATDAQAALCARRWQRAASEGLPSPRDPVDWLTASERLCSRLPGGLKGLMQLTSDESKVHAGDVTQQPVKQAAAEVGGEAAKAEDPAWRTGCRTLSQSPRIDFYPSFLSTDECCRLLTLALLHAEPTFKKGGEMDSGGLDGGGMDGSSDASGGRTCRDQVHTSGCRWRALLPPGEPMADVLEARFAAATGVPCHPAEQPADLKLTMEEPASCDEAKELCHEACGRSPPTAPMMSGLHVDTNNGGVGAKDESTRYRCATVIIYLNDLPEGVGGETRFPIANAPASLPLRAMGEAALRSGATVLRHGTSAEAGALLAAAEDPLTGLHIQPQKGAACVFWTMDAQGVDASSWHDGARVLHGAGGKWIMQKFKELPVEFRVEPLVLPAILQPPLNENATHTPVRASECQAAESATCSSKC